MSAWDDTGWRESAAEPWAEDPDAWRGEHHDASEFPLLCPWPQLDATPLYWMWCERLEREREIDQPDTP